MKLALIMDTLNAVKQESDFRASHPDDNILIVHSYDELETAINEHEKELRDEAYIGGMSTPVRISDVRRMIAEGKKTNST